MNKKSERSITDFLQELTFNLDILMEVRCHPDVTRPYQFVILTDLKLQQLLLKGDGDYGLQLAALKYVNHYISCKLARIIHSVRRFVCINFDY